MKKNVLTEQELIDLIAGLPERINRGEISEIRLGTSFKLRRFETDWLAIVIGIAYNAITKQAPISLLVSSDDIRQILFRLKDRAILTESDTIILYTILSHYYSMTLKERNRMVNFFLSITTSKKAAKLQEEMKDLNKRFLEMIKGQEVVYGHLNPAFHKRFNELIELGWRKKRNINKELIESIRKLKK